MAKDRHSELDVWRGKLRQVGPHVKATLKTTGVARWPRAVLAARTVCLRPGLIGLLAQPLAMDNTHGTAKWPLPLNLAAGHAMERQCLSPLATLIQNPVEHSKLIASTRHGTFGPVVLAVVVVE